MARKRSRAFLYSFVITLLVLGGLALALYATAGPVQSAHLPSTLPAYNPVWGRYVPSDAIFLSFINYTMITQTNSSLPGEGELLRLTSPPLILNRSDVRFLLEEALSTPNATLDIAFLNPSAFSTVTAIFAGRGEPPYVVDGAMLYTFRSTSRGHFQDGWVALLPKEDAVDFGVGVVIGKQAVVKSIDVASGRLASVMSRADIGPLLYIVGGDSDHYALSIQNFAGVVRTGQLTLTSIDRAGTSSVQVSYVVEFSDPNVASAQVQTVRSAYLSAHQFVVYDSYVKAIEYHPLGSLEAQVTLAE